MTIDEARGRINQKWVDASGPSAKDIWEMLENLLDIVEQRTGGAAQDDTATLLREIAELNSLLNNDAAIFQAIKDVLGRDDLTAAQLPAEIKLRLK